MAASGGHWKSGVFVGKTNYSKRYGVNPSSREVTIETTYPMREFVTSRRSRITIPADSFEKFAANTLAKSGRSIRVVGQG